VCLSVGPPPVTFERLNIFESRFRHMTYAVISRFKFIFISKSDGPLRFTVKGHIHMKYVSHHVRYCWKGLVTSIPTQYNFGHCDRYVTCRVVFKVNQVPHHVRCRWKGLVKSFLTIHERLQNVH
jgi:hypothetical protein